MKALLDSSVWISNWINEVVGLVRTKLLDSVYLTAQYSKSIPVSGKESNTFARLYEAIFKCVINIKIIIKQPRNFPKIS